VQFTSTQLDDVLKSLMALDLDNGTISAINYNSVAPIEQRLRALRMPTGSGAEANAFYNALRGARIDVTAPTGSISGRLLSVERRPRVRGDMEDEVDTLTVVSDAGLRRRAQGGGSADGSDGIVPAPPVVGQAARAASMTAAASAQDLGDLFEYRVDAPITIRKDQSVVQQHRLEPASARAVDHQHHRIDAGWWNVLGGRCPCLRRRGPHRLVEAWRAAARLLRHRPGRARRPQPWKRQRALRASRRPRRRGDLATRGSRTVGEDRLVSLRARIDSLAAERDSLQAAVAALLQRVEFDVAGTGQSR